MIIMQGNCTFSIFQVSNNFNRNFKKNNRFNFQIFLKISDYAKSADLKSISQYDSAALIEIKQDIKEVLEQWLQSK